MNDKIESIIDALRKKILESAIRGELVPQDPADEPASVLLERITKEREKLIREKKIKKPKSTSRILRRDGHFYESINGSEPVCIDEEIPFDIPDSWEWVRLGNITYGVGNKNNQVLAKEIKKIGKYPVVSQGAVLIDGYSNDANKVVDTLPLVMFGDHTRNVKYIDFPFIIGADGTKFLSPIVLSAQYLYFLLSFIAENLRNRGYARHFSLLSKEYLPLPPLQEQHRIVAAIEVKMERLTFLAESRKRYRRILSGTPTSLRQQLIQAAISGQLVPQNPNDEPASRLLERIAKERSEKLGKKATKSMSRIERHGYETYEIFPDGTEKDISKEIPFDIPESWEWARLENLASSNLGKTLDKAKNTGEPHRYLCSINVYWDGISLKPIKQALFEAEELEKYSVKRGDLLICEGGDVGRSAVWEINTPMCYQNALHRVRLYCGFNPYFVKHLLQVYKADGTIERMSKGMTIKHLVQGVLKKMLIPVPPLQEQQRIVKKLGALLDLM